MPNSFNGRQVVRSCKRFAGHFAILDKGWALNCTTDVNHCNFGDCLFLFFLMLLQSSCIQNEAVGVCTVV